MIDTNIPPQVWADTGYISFADELEHEFFEWGIHHPTVDQTVAWESVVHGASLTVREATPLDCDGYMVVKMKGLVSPLVAITVARREFVDERPLIHRHVWLRSSFPMFGGDYEWVTVDGRKGWGGSYQATVVMSPEDQNTYDNLIETTPIRCGITDNGLRERWCSFVQKVYQP